MSVHVRVVRLPLYALRNAVSELADQYNNLTTVVHTSPNTYIIKTNLDPETPTIRAIAAALTGEATTAIAFKNWQPRPKSPAARVRRLHREQPDLDYTELAIQTGVRAWRVADILD